RNDKQNRRTMGQISVFFRNYARRIDRLPVLNVDPELVDFGRWTSTSLREGQIAVTEAAGRSRMAQLEVGQGMGMGMGMGMAQNIGPWGAAPAAPAPTAAQMTPPPPPPAEKLWHTAADGKTAGPYSRSHLGRMITSGEFARDTLVWTAGQDGWKPAGEIAELAQLFTVAPPPPPGA
ncbi:MAG: DUF4339 domain-containing protein, partial [Paracoccaceae bacterium]